MVSVMYRHRDENVRLNQDLNQNIPSPVRSRTLGLPRPSELATTVDFEHHGWMASVSVLYINRNPGVFASDFSSALSVINLVLKNKAKTQLLSREQFRFREFVFLKSRLSLHRVKWSHSRYTVGSVLTEERRTPLSRYTYFQPNSSGKQGKLRLSSLYSWKSNGTHGFHMSPQSGPVFPLLRQVCGFV